MSRGIFLICFIMADMLCTEDEDNVEKKHHIQGSVNVFGASGTGDESNILPPLLKLEEYAKSENVYNRQLIGSSVPETLRSVAENPSDVDKVIRIIENAANDREAAVRADLVEHVPHIMILCHEKKNLQSLIVKKLLPITINLLSDSDSQVRKSTQTSLLVLMEQNLLDQVCIEETVCPAVLNLSSKEDCSVDIGAAVTLMSKMAPLLGSEATERLFVPQFVTLCSHNTFYVRKVCASNFGDFCAVVSNHTAETILLSRFVRLCRDEVWRVRKACAEVIMSVSCACRLEIRKAVLAPVFASLLSDISRWVRMSAFQTLGPFITTFAEPSITGLAYNQQGELVLMNPEGFEFKFLTHNSEDYSKVCEEGPNEIDNKKNVTNHFLEEHLKVPESEEDKNNNSHCNYNTSHSTTRNENEEDKFNTFQYWRDPLPKLDFEDKLIDLSNCDKDVNKLTSSLDNMKLTFPHPVVPTHSSQTHMVPLNVPSYVLDHPWHRYRNYNQPSQDIVPQQLIDHFVSMSDPEQASTTDNDLAHHCAFSLPAVALTLGPSNWSLLKNAYATLASDRQWKVRRTVASSIHELAVIVGEDVATEDLVPVFNGLIKDLDEVRIGALKHLAHFLKLLRPAGRNSFLPRLADFLMTDYDWNWRFREELAEQLLQVLGLFSPADTCTHLTPVAISLLLDKVAAVRHVALYLVTELVNHVSIDVCLLRGLLAELAEQSAHSSRWNRRQTFALLCSRLISERVLSDEMFACDVLPHLLDLSWDPVPNVRLAVARTLASDIMQHQYFSDAQTPHHEVLLQVLKRLQCDKDKDVRYFASLKSKQDTTNYCERSI